ncbi:hypothetical protein CNR22_09510 [Sphingobacteriaceae bacterium]|nr:hypothetical protein CNR22_09510 [Sphingobacteriaceae bacterium]
MALGLASCSVYTINKSDLESKLKPKENSHAQKKGLNKLAAMHDKHYVNAIDTLKCADAVGQIRTKRFNYDSKITVVTNRNKTIKFYAKTLYIYNDQFLVGERTTPSIYGPNYCLVKLSDISRIEVKKPWF